MADVFLTPVLENDPRFKALGQIALDAFKVDLVPVLVYMVDIVDSVVLPFLAEQFGLIGCGWELAQTDDAKRAMLKEAALINSRRGTPWAIKRVFALLGLGDVTLDEGRSGYVRDGTMRRDEYTVRGDRQDHWAEYRVRCQRLLTVEQANIARAMLSKIAPARCALAGIDFSDAALTRNGFAVRDGSYTRGVA